MTVVLATHEMSFAREISDTVCMLDGGVIIEQGSPESMFTKATNPRTRQFLSRVSSR
jgi:polar amino acid transport system ATP-binding protein